MRPLSPIEIAQRKALFRRYEALSMLAGLAFMICIFFAATAPDYQIKVIAGIAAGACVIVWYELIKVSRRYRTPYR